MSGDNPNATGTRRQQQKEETRILILESARMLFEEIGYDRTTVRAVAKEAGVGLGTIFLHFADKPALLTAVLYDDLENTLEKSILTVPEDKDICDQFLHVAKELYSYYARRPALSRVLIKHVLFITDSRGQKMEDRCMSIMTRILIDAQQQGELKTDIDCDLVASLFFSQYLYVLNLGLAEPAFNLEEAMRLLERLLKQIMEGIAISYNIESA